MSPGCLPWAELSHLLGQRHVTPELIQGHICSGLASLPVAGQNLMWDYPNQGSPLGGCALLLSGLKLIISLFPAGKTGVSWVERRWRSWLK